MRQTTNMNRRAIFMLSILACLSLRAELPERTVSPSQQFIIYGANAALRGALSELAEQTKANLIALLQPHDRWTTPIVINLQPQQANLPEIPPTACFIAPLPAHWLNCWSMAPTGVRGWHVTLEVCRMLPTIRWPI